jgi:predicted alpha/beta hydrolase family esterase
MAASAPVALVLHGSGSTAEFALRALGPGLRAAGYSPVGLDLRTGDVAEVEAALDPAVDTSVRLIAGISLGAHAAVRWAARREARGLEGLWLVLPAWTGEPDPVAALSSAAADEIAAEGLEAALARVGPQGWVGAELARAWPEYGEEGLIAVLRQTARSPGPDRADLAALAVPCAVVGITDDPFHPAAVAGQWAAAIPGAALRLLAPEEPAADVAALGRAALVAWRDAIGWRDAVSGSR